MIACAVYDPSTLSGNGQSPLTDGGEQAGGDGSTKGGTQTQDGGAAGTTAGSRNTAGTSGAPGGGAGGLSGSSGGGTPAVNAGSSSGGHAGAGNSSGNSGSGNGGSAGSSDSGGNAGSAGAGPTVELALGKVTTASTEESGHPSSDANDGVSTTRWAANGPALPQWWRVDLGSLRTLQGYSLSFEHADRDYSYTVETSLDGISFANSQTKGGKAPQTGTFASIQARYVRVTVTASNPASYASLLEASVTGY
jgi:hypothetical protein